ncbi:hypothetical protein A0H81_03166 [Grifola frondosa]|uniref:Plus3 domain-containing protein n=1 Tax=Grifola frondosa TaxID=5627 RepID=A0A1C7MJF5_GRIFR|nr:hypothetical protein A0H81_03166 [Grifola frondosa]
MSDSEGDISDELLELAGATEKKRKKRQAKSPSSKRRKQDITHDSDSDEDQPESEEEDGEANPYPLEGKYIDDADRLRLLEMSEVDREAILAQRLEEMQRFTDKRQLDHLLKLQNGRNGEDSVSKAAKRQHAVRGATKEKSRKLDELKARRKAKDEKKRTRTNSPKRERSSSPMDMETSDDEEEDGQITKYDEQEERDRRIYNKVNPDEEAVTIDDLSKCRLTRDMLAKHCMAPWFEDYVKGAWVRYLIGQETSGESVYRLCEIHDITANPAKPYKLNDQTVNQEIELKHGESMRKFAMDKVSNAPFQSFERLAKVLESEKLKLPTKRQLEKKSAQLIKLANQPVTESDIAAMLARKSMLHSNKHSVAWATMEKSRLTQARTLAYRRQDYAEVEQIDAQLAELAANAPSREASRELSTTDMLAKVNERNRRANMEAVRKAEMLEAERKRRERKLLASGAPLPPIRPPGTPGTPLPTDGGVTPRSVSPLPPSALSPQAQSTNTKKNFEASLMQSVEIDLGDF